MLRWRRTSLRRRQPCSATFQSCEREPGKPLRNRQNVARLSKVAHSCIRVPPRATTAGRSFVNAIPRTKSAGRTFTWSGWNFSRLDASCTRSGAGFMRSGAGYLRAATSILTAAATFLMAAPTFLRSDTSYTRSGAAFMRSDPSYTRSDTTYIQSGSACSQSVSIYPPAVKFLDKSADPRLPAGGSPLDPLQRTFSLERNFCSSDRVSRPSETEREVICRPGKLHKDP